MIKVTLKTTVKLTKISNEKLDETKILKRQLVSSFYLKFNYCEQVPDQIEIT